MQDTLIDQGLSLMLFGMGTVFVFLTILVFATGLMSRIVTKLEPQETTKSPDATTRPPTSKASTSAKSMPSVAQISAIEKAIAAHRQR